MYMHEGGLVGGDGSGCVWDMRACLCLTIIPTLKCLYKSFSITILSIVSKALTYVVFRY